LVAFYAERLARTGSFSVMLFDASHPREIAVRRRRDPGAFERLPRAGPFDRVTC